MGKFKFKSSIIALSLFGMSLTIYGAYAGFFYYTGGIGGDQGEINPDLESFDYPEFTVNFYSAGSTSPSGESYSYSKGRELKATHTYYSYAETFTFPGQEISNYPDATFSHWSSTPIYYEPDDGYVAYTGDGSDQPLAYEDVISKKYYANQTYKVEDIDWGEDNVIDLYEICTDNYLIIGNETEKTKVFVCDPGTSHINSGMSTNHKFEFPHLDITVGISGRPWNNQGPAFSFATLYVDTSTPFLSKDPLLATHTAYYDAQSTNRFFRLVKPIPGNGENRVSLDSERDYTWVNSSEKIVECYDDTDVWKIYISPGYYLLGTVDDTYIVTGVYSKPLIATEGHANCTFEHKANGDVIVNGNYQTTNPQSYAFNENLLYQSETDTVMRWRWAEEYKNDYCACVNHVGGTLNDNKTEGNTGNCLVEGTPILLTDGTYTNVENIKAGDEVAIINHETGELDSAPITFNDFEPLDTYDVVKLNFSNGEEIELVYEHGFFDLDRNEYVYIRENNYQDYIGHRFYTNTEKGYATLLSGSVEKQYTRLYSPVSYFHCNYFTGSLLSMPGGITGLFNIFDIEDNSLRYDQVKKQADIEEFGLFTYEDFKDYATEEMFNAFPTKYFKVAIGKGLITMEHIMYLIERYACKCN